MFERNNVYLIILIIFIESGAYLVLKLGLFSNEASYTLPDKNTQIPDSYVNVDWYKEYTEEISTIFYNVAWSSYVYWKTEPFKGKYININHDSTRKTWTPASMSHKSHYNMRIFMFGGSTLWGWGARDDFTIPSLVRKILYDEYKIDAEIINFGEMGYVSTQEVIRLIRELQRQNLPSLVIFYDGLNDVFSTLQPGQTGTSGLPYNEFKRSNEYKYNIIEKIIHSYMSHSNLHYVINRFLIHEPFKELKQLTPSQLNKIADDTISVYKENIKIVKALSNFYGFKTLFYWQPTLFTKNDLTSYERKLENTHSYAHPLYKIINKKIEDIENEGIYNISYILSNYKCSFYVDPWHIDEKGNQIIAKKIAEDIHALF